MIMRRDSFLAPGRLKAVMLQADIGEPGDQPGFRIMHAPRVKHADIDTVMIEDALADEAAHLLPVIGKQPVTLAIAEASAIPQPEPLNPVLYHVTNVMNGAPRMKHPSDDRCFRQSDEIQDRRLFPTGHLTDLYKGAILRRTGSCQVAAQPYRWRLICCTSFQRAMAAGSEIKGALKR